MADQIKYQTTTSISGKAILVAVPLLSLVITWFAVRWQIGDMIGELTSPGEDGAAQIAKAAIDLAPADPRSSWILGAVLRSDFTPEATNASVTQLQNSVRLSPNQSRWWSELGRSQEQAGDYENAEAAFKRAVDLAPEYTLPNWQLGNFYLRRSRVPEAVQPLKKAAEHSRLYRAQVFSIAWSYFGNDPQMVEQFSSGQPDVRAGLVAFYANLNRPDDALRVWNSLSEEEKAQFDDIAKGAAKSLFFQHSFAGSIELSRQAGLDKYARPGAFTNGDFESGLKEKDQHIFDWSIHRTDSKAEISTDTTVTHGGKRSLRVTFRSFATTTLFVFDQIVGVRPATKQRIEFWVRTENLKSGGMPAIAVLNGSDDKVLAVSQAFPSGTNDWQMLSIDVDVPENTDGIRVQSAREGCGAECPMTGLFWVDDFTITEIGQQK